MGIYCRKDSILHANPLATENIPAVVTIESLSGLIERTKIITKGILITRR